MIRFTASQMAAFEALSRARGPDRALETLRSEGIDATRDPATGDVLAKDARGNVSRLEFAKDGRLEAFRWPSGRTVRFGYDAQGRIESATHPDGVESRVERDTQSRITAFETVGHARYGFSYDALSRLVAIRHPDGRVESVEYGDAGELAACIDASGAERKLVREPGGEYWVDPNGRRLGVWLDEQQQVAGTEFPDGGREEYGFDPEANTAWIRQRDGSRIDIATDASGRPASFRWSDASHVAFAYDGEDRVVAATSPAGTIALTYDEAGRLASESSSAGKIEVAYDGDGRLASLKSSQGEVRYDYDEDGRLVAVVDWDGRPVRFRYGAGVQPVSIEYPNAVVEERSRTLGPLAVRAMWRGPAGSTLGGWWAEFDACDRVVKLIDAWDATREHQLRRTIRYDAGGRLAGESNAASGTPIADFAYDAAGNMVRDGSIPIATGALDEVASRGASQVRYDGLGNATELDSGRGRVKCRYSADNRLRQIEVGDRTWRYDYDAFCRRIAKSDGTQSWKYGWVGACMLWEEHRVSPDAPPRRRDYLYAPGFPAPIAFREAGRTYWLSHDHRGAVVAAHDEAGKLAWRAIYDGFGNLRTLVDNVPQPWRLAGQYEDDESGLYYNFVRYYSPLLKAYLSLDPLAAETRARNYAYCANEPWNNADPHGMLHPIIWGAVVGGVIGGVMSGIMSDRSSLEGKVNDALAGAAAGAVGGALAVVLVPLNPVIGGAAVGAVEGGLQSILSNYLNEEKVDWECAKKSALAGAIVGSVTAGLLGTVGRPLLRKAAGKIEPIVKKVGDFVKRITKKPTPSPHPPSPGKPTTGSTGTAGKGPVKFKDIDGDTEKAIDKFNKGEQGASVKGVDLKGKSLRELDDELGGQGGWKTDPATGKKVSADGSWSRTEQVITQNPDGTPCTPYRMIFYENADGGVVRIKPDGMPDAKFDHMKQPHGAKYVKKDPAAGTDFKNEAFKVDGDQAIPSTPKQLELPPGVKEGTPEAERYIAEHWKTPSHEPLGKD